MIKKIIFCGWLMCCLVPACIGQSNNTIYQIVPDRVPNDGIMFVNHQAESRSGHGGQTMTQCKNGDIIAFYSNVDGNINRGHNTGGWSEYKISSDGGKTWSAPNVFPYSKKVWDERDHNKIISMLIWEVMTAPNGTVVALGRSSDSATRWGGDAPPLYFLSYDNGKTWSEPKQVSKAANPGISREEASLVKGGEMFILYHDFYAADRTFKLYVSKDNGETFQQRSVLPFAKEQWYGTMGILPNGDIIVYTYNDKDDGAILKYLTSSDNGNTWSEVKETKMAKRIRKPRMSAQIKGYYFMTGRSGHAGSDPRNLVLYMSKDGINWDEGIFLNKGGKDIDSYSANLVVKPKGNSQPSTLLVQASVSYDKNLVGRVNLKHWFIQLK